MNIFLLKITSNGLLAGMMAVFCCSMGNAQISYSNSLAGATLIYSNSFSGSAVNITNTPPNLAVSLLSAEPTAPFGLTRGERVTPMLFMQMATLAPPRETASSCPFTRKPIKCTL